MFPAPCVRVGINDDLVTNVANDDVKVENVLFNVTRSTFTRHSRVFRDIFSLPRCWNPSEEVEGSSDRHPVHFSGISSVDFERLLWILYPLCVRARLFLRLLINVALTGSSFCLYSVNTVFGNLKQQTNGTRSSIWQRGGNSTTSAPSPSARYSVSP